jgi:hypothetical protein
MFELTPKLSMPPPWCFPFIKAAVVYFLFFLKGCLMCSELGMGHRSADVVAQF